MDNDIEQLIPDLPEENTDIAIQSLSPEERITIECIKRIKYPFKMVGIKEIMNDLHIGKNNAYKVFQREDFPSINVGKATQVMILPYILWKMKKRD